MQLHCFELYSSIKTIYHHNLGLFGAAVGHANDSYLFAFWLFFWKVFFLYSCSLVCFVVSCQKKMVFSFFIIFLTLSVEYFFPFFIQSPLTITPLTFISYTLKIHLLIFGISIRLHPSTIKAPKSIFNYKGSFWKPLINGCPWSVRSNTSRLRASWNSMFLF